MRNIANFSRNQAIAIEAIRQVPEWAQQAPLTGSAISAVVRHLAETHGISAGGVLALVEGGDEDALTEYPVVDGLKLSLWGDAGAREISHGAFTRSGNAAPMRVKFNEIPVDGAPNWLDTGERQTAQELLDHLNGCPVDISPEHLAGVMTASQHRARQLLTHFSAEDETMRRGIMAAIAHHLDHHLGAWCQVVSYDRRVDGNPQELVCLRMGGVDIFLNGETSIDAAMAAEQGGVLLGIARILKIDDLQPVNLDSFNRVKLNLDLLELAKKQAQARQGAPAVKRAM